jgi:hypothetical protein
VGVSKLTSTSGADQRLVSPLMEVIRNDLRYGYTQSLRLVRRPAPEIGASTNDLMNAFADPVARRSAS